LYTLERVVVWYVLFLLAYKDEADTQVLLFSFRSDSRLSISFLVPRISFLVPPALLCFTRYRLLYPILIISSIPIQLVFIPYFSFSMYICRSSTLHVAYLRNPIKLHHQSSIHSSYPPFTVHTPTPCTSLIPLPPYHPIPRPTTRHEAQYSPPHLITTTTHRESG